MARSLLLFLLTAAVCGTVWAKPPEPPPAIPEDCRVWFEPGAGDGAGRATVILDCAGSQSANAPISVKGKMRAERAVGKVTLRCRVSSSDGAEVFRKSVDTTLDQEEGSFQFSWDTRALQPGSYDIHFELLRPPGFTIVKRDYVVRKASPKELQERFAAASQLVGPTQDRLRSLAETGARPPYLRMRVEIASAYVQVAQQALDAQDWPRADAIIRYIEDTDKSAQAQLAFGKTTPELWDAVDRPAPESIAIENGGFVSEGRPVFLVGEYFGKDPKPEDVARLEGYGLNLASFSCGPDETLASATENTAFRAKLDPVFQAANERRTSVLVSLAPQSMPAWAIAQWPCLAETQEQHSDVTQPSACEIIERHVKALVPYLAEQKALEGIAIMENPSFKFTGEQIRQRFLGLVKEHYTDRHTLNQAWKGLFADMNEVEIGWNHVNPRYQDSSAYRYDWQTFHQTLGTEYIEWLKSLAQEANGKPLAVAFADNSFAQGESEFGIDREALSAQMDISGVCASNGYTSPIYAFEYPKSLLTYVLMKSLAPGKPLVNFDSVLTANQTPDNPCSFNYLRTMVWEAVMAGVNGLALHAEKADLIPACFEGYATACIDLNRLAPIVAAFQQAPADVAIFWSMSSKIFNNGVPHVDTVGYAYEGCSFSGYKVRLVSEKQCLDTKLDDVKVLVVPDSPAVADEVFDVLKKYMEGNGAVVRTSFSILYDKYGHSRRDIINDNNHTVLVRGQNLPTEYLHAMDAVSSFEVLPRIPRAVNTSGYPLEGVKSRYVNYAGEEYLYIVNLRKEHATVNLTEGVRTGVDLISGGTVAFPLEIDPLVPMLVRLDKVQKS